MSASGNLRNQIVAGLCANFISVSYGAFCGWPSASFLVLQSPDSPLTGGPLSNDEAGWVGAMLCIGGFCGTVLVSACASRIGNKRCLLLIGLPSMVLGWLIIPFAQNATHLMASRFAGGFAGGAIFSVIPAYTTELSDDKVRGLLGSFLVLSCNVGILCVFVLGNYCSYSTVAWIMAAYSLLYLATFTPQPETPFHLMSKQKYKEAELAWRYFRNIHSSIAFKELPHELQLEVQQLKGVEMSTTQKETLSMNWGSFTNHTSMRALLIGCGLMALNQFCGLFAMLNYTASIFKQAGSSFSPNVAAIIVGVIQLLGSYMSTALVERAGRKLLLVISAIGSGIGLASLGGYSYLTQLGYDSSGVFAWIPVASFSFSIFIACWGVLPLPFLIVSEIMPPEIRNVGSMICMLLLWLFAFLILKFLPVMSIVFGMHGLMWTFSSCCLLGAAFVLFFVPETKGKSIETILAAL